MSSLLGAAVLAVLSVPYIALGESSAAAGLSAGAGGSAAAFASAAAPFLPGLPLGFFPGFASAFVSGSAVAFAADLSSAGGEGASPAA